MKLPTASETKHTSAAVAGNIHLFKEVIQPILFVTQLSPLVNFDMLEEAVDLSPGVRVRRLVSCEIEDWVNGANSQQISAMPVYQLRSLHCAFEITHRLDKDEYGADAPA